MLIRTLRLAAMSCAALLFHAQPALAQSEAWPQRPITLVVPFAAGGGTDSLAREYALELGALVNQAVVVENRGGGGGSIGAARVANAAPDGLTLLFATSTFATNAAWEKSLPYDARKAFTPVALLGTGPLMLVASPEIKVKQVSDLLSLAKAEPGSLNYCSAGPGSINHLSGALFQQRTELDIQHVPYRGSSPATLDLLAGRVQLFFATMPTMLEHVKAGKVNLLAVTTKQRSALFPDVPTLEESGIPDYDISTWWGILAPAGTPDEIVQKLNQLTNDITARPLISKRLASEGGTVFTGSPADFTAHLNKEMDLWDKVVTSMPSH